MTLLRSIATVGGFTLISRGLGFVRDMLIAAVLGAGMVADAFVVAFRLPNLFRSLFAEGAFSAAFVPLFAERLTEDGPEGARAFSEQALGVLVTALLLFVFLFEALMPAAMYVIAPGFADEPEKFALAVLLTRITFPYLLFISMASLMSGVLNSLGRFAAPAATPILLNLTMIGAVFGLAPFTPTPGHALAWGISAAGAAQFAWLLVSCAQAGMALRLSRPRLTPGVRRLLKRILPVAVGAGMYQVNLLIGTMLATLLPAGAISYLFYADRVSQLPLGVVGVAVGTALLPLVSRQIKSGDEGGALHSQNRAIEFACLLTLPAAAALIVIAQPIVSVLFQRGAFGPAETQATAAALAVFAAGLPAFVLVKALTPAFFARDDTKTPIRVAGVSLAANVILNLVLMGPFRHVGIAAAATLAAWINVAGLGVVLHRRGHLVADARLRARLPRALLATLLMAVCLALADHALADVFRAPFRFRLGALTVLVGGGLGAFALFAKLAGAAHVADLKQLFRSPGPAP